MTVAGQSPGLAFHLALGCMAVVGLVDFGLPPIGLVQTALVSSFAHSFGPKDLVGFVQN